MQAVHSPHSYSGFATLPVAPAIKRRITDEPLHADVLRKIREALHRLQMARQDLVVHGHFFPQSSHSVAAPDRDVLGLVAHVQLGAPMASVSYSPTARNMRLTDFSPYQVIPLDSPMLPDDWRTRESYAQMVWDLHLQLEAHYPNLEEAELLLLLVEALADGSRTQQALIQKVWAKAFNQPIAGWDQEIGRTALEIFQKKLELCFRGAFHYFDPAIEFLEAIGQSLSSTYRQAWISNCADQLIKVLSKEHLKEFHEALATAAKGCAPDSYKGCLAKELSARKIFNQLREESMDSRALIKTIEQLDVEEIVLAGIWGLVLEKVCVSDSNELKQKAWSLWSKQHAVLDKDSSYHALWCQACGLLEHASAEEASTFFCSSTFAALLAFHEEKLPSQLASFYAGILKSAAKCKREHPVLIGQHQNFMTKYAVLGDERIFDLVLPALKNSLNSKQEDERARAYSLMQQYLHKEQIQKEMLTKLYNIFRALLQKGEPQNIDAVGMQGLAAKIVELAPRHEKLIDCYEIAQSLAKWNSNHFCHLSLQFALQGIEGLMKAANEGRTKEKEKIKRCEEYFALMASILPNLNFQQISRALESGILTKICRSLPHEKWMVSQARNFWKGVAHGLLVLEKKGEFPVEESVQRILHGCAMWEFIKDDANASRQFAEAMIDDMMAILPAKGAPYPPEYNRVFRGTCQKLADTFATGVALKVSGTKVEVVHRPVDDLVLRLCAEAAANLEQQDLLLSTAVSIVLDEGNLKACVESGSACKVVLSCLDALSKPSSDIFHPQVDNSPSGSFKAPGPTGRNSVDISSPADTSHIDQFAIAQTQELSAGKKGNFPLEDGMVVRELLLVSLVTLIQQPQMRSVLKSFAKDEAIGRKMCEMVRQVIEIQINIISASAAQAPSLDPSAYEEKIESSRRRIITLISYFLSVDYLNVEMKKDLWKQVFDAFNGFAGKVSVQFWSKCLYYLVDAFDDWIDLEADIGCKKSNGISLNLLTQMIDVYDDPADKLHRTATQNPELKAPILSLLMRMADLQINYRNSTQEKKRSLFQGLIKLAVECTPISSKDLRSLANSAEDFIHSQACYRIKVKGRDVSILDRRNQHADESEQEKEELDRAGTEFLFRNLHFRVNLENSSNALKLAGKMLSVVRFDGFRGPTNFRRMLTIFSSLVNNSTKINAFTVITSGFFHDVFFALAHMKTKMIETAPQAAGNAPAKTSSKEIRHIMDLVGTKDLNVIVLTRECIDNIIATFMAAYRSSLADPAFTPKLQVESLMPLLEFLIECNKKGLLDSNVYLNYVSMMLALWLPLKEHLPKLWSNGGAWAHSDELFRYILVRVLEVSGDEYKGLLGVTIAEWMELIEECPLKNDPLDFFSEWNRGSVPGKEIYTLSTFAKDATLERAEEIHRRLLQKII